MFTTTVWTNTLAGNTYKNTWVDDLVEELRHHFPFPLLLAFKAIMEDYELTEERDDVGSQYVRILSPIMRARVQYGADYIRVILERCMLNDKSFMPVQTIQIC